MLNTQELFIATLIAGGVTFITRAAPFIFLKNSKSNPSVIFLQNYIPPMTMVILVIYCIKDVSFTQMPFGFDVLAGIMTTAILHIFKNNPLISIFSGTAVYMFLIRLL